MPTRQHAAEFEVLNLSIPFIQARPEGYLTFQVPGIAGWAGAYTSRRLQFHAGQEPGIPEAWDFTLKF